MQQVDPHHFAPRPAGSARVSEAVARVLRARGHAAMGAMPTRRDPAPSRAAYRLSRLWLTPSFRFLMRRVLPLALVGAIGAAYFADEAHRRQVTDAYAQIKRDVQNRPEFMVKLMAIDGASPELSEDIRDVTNVDFPLSSFDLDLPGLLDQIAELDAVATARVRVRAGGILQVDITERVPAVVWRGPQGLELLDPEGRRVAGLASRVERADLPLIAGEGADRAVGEALALIAAAGPLTPRLRGLVRVGERRWTLVLDRDQEILLPETSPLPALAQVIALDQAKDLLARDIAAVDMRNPVRPTLRLVERPDEESRLTQAQGVSRP